MGNFKRTIKKISNNGFLKTHGLTIATFAGVLLGVGLGLLLKIRESPWNNRERMYIKFIGNLFLQMLKGIIIPLVIPSLIVAVGSLDIKLSGKIGGRAIAFFMSTTLVAVVIGIILVTTIKPGVGMNNNSTEEAEERYVTTEDTLMDLVRNLFPENIIQASLQKVQTFISHPGDDIPEGSTIDLNDTRTWPFEQRMADGSNILGMIVSAIVFGVAIAIVGEEADPVLKFFTSITVIVMRITQWIILLAPVGVLFLVAGQILDMDDLAETFSRLGLYTTTVMLGLTIHGLVVLPLLYAIITRTLPFRFISNMANVLATAFGTSSSNATLPVNIETLETRNKIDPRVTRFVLPIGATVNMNGSALYEAVAPIFIAQIRKIDLSIGNLVAISITATAASIGAAGIPQAGLVTMVMVLETVGLPSTEVGLILAVDWLLDRFRTVVNVMGDAIGAGIVYHLSKKELDELDAKKEQEAIEGGEPQENSDEIERDKTQILGNN